MQSVWMLFNTVGRQATDHHVVCLRRPICEQRICCCHQVCAMSTSEDIYWMMDICCMDLIAP